MKKLTMILIASAILASCGTPTSTNTNKDTINTDSTSKVSDTLVSTFLHIPSATATTTVTPVKVPTVSANKK